MPQVNHNADTAAARAAPSGLRTTYIELVVPGKDKLALLRDALSPRHVKWHHSAWLLPAPVVANGKIIYLYRNPKDLVVSWYHFQRLNPVSLPAFADSLVSSSASCKPLYRPLMLVVLVLPLMRVVLNWCVTDIRL